MNNGKYKKIVFLIFFLAVAIRFVNITMPILEGTAMRQAQTAMIARNFYKEGINMLYPKADHFGSSAGYLVLEFPLMNTIVSFGYMLLGGVYEWIARLLSILFFCAAAYFLFSITRKIFNKEIALWTLVVFGFSPLSIIFSRAFMPDFEMLFLSLAALYFFLNFYMGDKYSNFWISGVFLSLALLIKPHSFYIFIPLLYLIWKKQKHKLFFNYRNWLYLIITMLPAILWYLHGSQMHSKFTQEQAYNYQLLNWFNPKELINSKLYLEVIKIYAGILLTPMGLVLFLMGLFIKTKGRENFIWAWLAGAGLYLFAFITHIWEPYYHLNILPIASIFIARAIIFIKQKIKRSFLNYALVGVSLLILFFPFWLRYTAYAYIVPRGYRYIPETGKRVQAISKESDLVIVSAAGGVQGLYFCDRKGWEFLLPVTDEAATAKAIERLESLRKAGAKFFVATVIKDFNESRFFKEYLFKNYRLIEHKPDKYIIFSLDK